MSERRDWSRAPSQETDPEYIHERFIELPSSEVELLASNLQRPDGFAKMLILGGLRTSKELQKNLGDAFPRTQRGTYMANAQYNMPHHLNDYLSFKVGKVDRDYTEPSRYQREVQLGERRPPGLGVVFPAAILLAKPTSAIGFGQFESRKAIQEIPPERMEPEFAPIVSASYDQHLDWNLKPPKELFLALAQLARKTGYLSDGDQGELNLYQESEGSLPMLSLDDGIILIPAGSRPAMERLLRIKLLEMKPYTERIRTAYGVDIETLTPAEILNTHKNIYWYPQEDISLAVEYLTTRPDLIERIRETVQVEREKTREIPLPYALRHEETKKILGEIMKDPRVQEHLDFLRTHHPDSYEHCVRVGALSVDLALDEPHTHEQVLLIGTGGLLHDLGKCDVAEELLSKEGMLTDEERKEMMTHTRHGFDRLDEPQFTDIRRIVVAHHEHKKSPYPRSRQERRTETRVANDRRVSDEQIKQYTAVVAVADFLDALASRRSYKAALPLEQIEQIIRSQFTGDRTLIERVLARYQEPSPTQ